MWSGPARDFSTLPYSPCSKLHFANEPYGSSNHHSVTLVDLFQRRNLELNLGLGQSEIGFACSAQFPQQRRKWGWGCCCCPPRPMCSLVSCFRALRLQRDLGTGERERDSSFPGGVSSPLSASLLSPLARPGQFMKIKPIPRYRHRFRIRGARKWRERVEQLSLMNFNHERKSGKGAMKIDIGPATRKASPTVLDLGSLECRKSSSC